VSPAARSVLIATVAFGQRSQRQGNTLADALASTTGRPPGAEGS